MLLMMRSSLIVSARQSMRLDGRAVAQHRDRVGDAGELVQLVRNQDRGDALRLELEQQVEQRVAVGLVEAGGRLVEDQQLDLLGSALAISTSCCLPTPRLVISVFGDSFRPTLASSSRVRLKAASQSMTPHPRRLVAEEDVLGDRQQRHQRQFLMDDDDAERARCRRCARTPLLALEEDLALVGAVRIDAAQHLHQRRLAGAVLAADRVDLAVARPRD